MFNKTTLIHAWKIVEMDKYLNLIFSRPFLLQQFLSYFPTNFILAKYTLLVDVLNTVQILQICSRKTRMDIYFLNIQFRGFQIDDWVLKIGLNFENSKFQLVLWEIISYKTSWHLKYVCKIEAASIKARIQIQDDSFSKMFRFLEKKNN